MKKISIMRRVGAFLVAGAVALGANAVAMAADSVDFDAKKTGSITVHKHYGDPMAGAKSNGKEEKVTNEPLKGVKFKIEKVNNVDLTTNAGWVKAAKIQSGAEKATFDPAMPEKTTTETGEVKFADLAVGLYRVTEVDASNATKANGEKVNVKMAAPFYVSVPMTDPDNRSKWMYDIHVYPKNQAFTVVKTASVIAGDKVRYTVVATLPKLEDGKHYEKYNLIDQLSNMHDIDSFTMEKIEAIQGASDSSATPITVVNNTETDKKTYAGQNRVLVKFTDAGLKELEKASKAGKTEIRYIYTVNVKSDLKEGTLSNTAYVAPSNEYSDEPNDNTPNGRTEKKFVQFQIQKQDSVENNKKLAGAEFDLYACDTNGKFLKTDGTGTTDKTAEAIKLNKDKVVTIEADGKSAAIRIPVANTNEKDIKKICAVETKAPNGYTLLTEPVAFEVNYAENTTTTAVVKAIDNVKDNAGWKLPLTGANALIVLTIAGVLLIAGSILIPMTRRNSNKDTK